MCRCLEYPHTVRCKRKQYCQHPRHYIGNQLIDSHRHIKNRISSNADNKSQSAKKQIQSYLFVLFITRFKNVQYWQHHHPLKNLPFLLHSSFPLLLLYCLNAILSIANSFRKYKAETVLPSLGPHYFIRQTHSEIIFVDFIGGNYRLRMRQIGRYILD